jgi:hypothetical protein
MVGGIGGPGGGSPPGSGKIGGVGGPSAPASGATGAGGAQKASFQEALGTRATDQASGASPLERLRSGELDLRGYIDARVRDATSHLEGVLSPDDLAKVHDELRDAIENDPDVAALVKGAEIGR